MNNGTIMLPVGTRPPTFPNDDAENNACDPADIIGITNLARRRLPSLARLA